MTTQYKNLINGELVDNGQWIDVVNPATEQVIGQVPDCGQADLDKAVAAARPKPDRKTPRSFRDKRPPCLHVEDQARETNVRTGSTAPQAHHM